MSKTIKITAVYWKWKLLWKNRKNGGLIPADISQNNNATVWFGKDFPILLVCRKKRKKKDLFFYGMKIFRSVHSLSLYQCFGKIMKNYVNTYF